MSEALMVKCVRCGHEAGFGDYAASPGAPTKEEFVEQIVGMLGWRQTFAGWQCPNHAPAGRVPRPKRAAQGIEGFAGDAEEWLHPKGESPVAEGHAPNSDLPNPHQGGPSEQD